MFDRKKGAENLQELTLGGKRFGILEACCGRDDEPNIPSNLNEKGDC
jgi:hypothetical protein